MKTGWIGQRELPKSRVELDITIATQTYRYLREMRMSTANKNLEKDEVTSPESDDFKYEEVSLEDEWSLTEGEEDLEATVKAIQGREETTAAAAASRPNVSHITDQPEAADAFIRKFLYQMGMTETLDCFQTEWTEVVQKGLVDALRFFAVPQVYTDNRRLYGELKNAQQEREEYRRAATAAAETLARAQKARDLQRLQHKRVVQEKNRLIEEMRRLKVQCDRQEPAVKRMNEKYQAVLRQTMQVTLDRDKAVGLARSAQQDFDFCGGTSEEGTANRTEETSVNGTTHYVIHPRPPTPVNTPKSQARVHVQRATTEY